ncbi:hypothetical protein A3197_17240 [Candidatus Thiodiazotropha endoloripes]|nr:hypothetical protein A3197_17240 [Candidatus Thiodiazotropha endoloripes]
MLIKYLIIDDQIIKGEARKTNYQSFLTALNKKSKMFEFAFDYLEDISNLHETLFQNRYDGAIVDVVLYEYWKTANLDDVIEKLRKQQIPVALVSKHWNDLNTDELNRAFNTKYVKTVLNWRDVAGKDHGEVMYAISQLIQLACEQKDVAPITIQPSESLFLLHISDLQFGGFQEQQLRQEASLMAQKVLAACKGVVPHFIAVTGDVAERASLSEYDAAITWLELFLAMLTEGVNTPPQVLVVPGNHDVSIPLAAASRAELKKNVQDEFFVELSDKLQQPDLIPYAYIPYVEFVDEISDIYSNNIQSDGLTWVESRFRHLGVIFYGVNTSSPANPFGLPDRTVSSGELTSVIQTIQSVFRQDGDKSLVVGLCHHSPVTAKDDESVTNVEAFQAHFSNDVKTGLFLHGHVHKRSIAYTSEDGYRLVRSCASTLNKDATARPKDTLRGFNIIEFLRKNNKVYELKALDYNWHGNQLFEGTERQFVLQEDGMFKEK